jgi:hypothetical protein
MTESRTIGPTPERLKKAGENVEAFTPDRNENWRAIRMLDDHVLERLASRNVITGDQHAAGIRFYADWYTAGLAASGVIDPGRVIVDGGKMEQVSERKLEAAHRWSHAVRAVGKIHSLVLIDVILLEKSLEEYGHRRYGSASPKIAKRDATVALMDALSSLDLHYYGVRNAKTRASHVEGYRPEIVPAGDGA